MSETYRINRAWSDRFLNRVIQIIAPLMIVPTPDEIDMEQAADLMVLTAKNMKIAVRIRRPGYAERYPFDFTIRLKLPSGHLTEMAKIVSGWGDWMFYGHSSGERDELSRWMVIDLHKFRRELIRSGYIEGWEKLSTKQKNPDGIEFLAFDVRKMPGITIATSHNITNSKEAAGYE